MFSLVYVWSKLEPDWDISIWGFQIKSKFMPWAMMGFGVLTGGSPFNDLIGVAVGHLYYFLTEVLPESHGHNPIKTPNWIRRAVLWANNIGVDPRL